MFDPSKTVELIAGGLISPRATWESRLGENPGWQRTAIQLTVPMIVSAIIIGWLLSVLFVVNIILGVIFGLGAATDSATRSG